MTLREAGLGRGRGAAEVLPNCRVSLGSPGWPGATGLEASSWNFLYVAPAPARLSVNTPSQALSVLAPWRLLAGDLCPRPASLPTRPDPR